MRHRWKRWKLGFLEYEGVETNVRSEARNILRNCQNKIKSGSARWQHRDGIYLLRQRKKKKRNKMSHSVTPNDISKWTSKNISLSFICTLFLSDTINVFHFYFGFDSFSRIFLASSQKLSTSHSCSRIHIYNTGICILGQKFPLDRL